MRVDEIQHLLLPAAFHLNRQRQVRPVETGDDHLGIAAEQPGDDVVTGDRVGGGRQRGDRHTGKGIPQPREVGVFRAEGGAPLRDAMRFVDGKQLRVQPGQRSQHLPGHQPFRRQIEQLCLAVTDAVPGGDVFVARQRGIDRLGGDAVDPQRRNLVFHQRHQGRDHHRQPVHDERGHLIAKRFSRTCRHNSQQVAASQ